MKTSLLRTQLFLGLGLSAALVAPLAIVVACGSSSGTSNAEEAPVPTLSPEETTAQKTIIDAPATLAAKATLSDRVLFELKEAVKDVAGTTPLADYLAKNKPSFESPTGALKYEKILMPELKLALGIPASTKFEFSDFTGLLTKLGLDATKFATNIFQPAAKNYDGQKSDATASWDAQIKFWNFVFNPANRYANLATLLKTNGLITDAMLLSFDKVIATPMGEFSDVDDADGNQIMGLGGKAIFNDLPVAPAEPTEDQYLMRMPFYIIKSITGDPAAPQIDLGQLNNIFEVYIAIAYALKIKNGPHYPIASFWLKDGWEGLAKQLFEANYAANITFKLGSVVSPAPSAASEFAAADYANTKLVGALRQADEPQVKLELTDYIWGYNPSNFYGEDLLTDSGFSKVWGIGSKLLSNPLFEALTYANSEYALRVLLTLATLSPKQFQAFGELLTGLEVGLKSLFARLDTTIKQAGAEAKFAPGDKINLWAPPRWEKSITKNNLRLANFFMLAFTKQFEDKEHVLPPSD